MWSADIFDAETSTLVEGASFRTYEELRGWLIAMIGARRGAPIWASFEIPADATKTQRSALEALGPGRPALN